MKEKRSYKRFDLVSALAVLGILLVLLFESCFIFEFYRVDYGKIEPYLPGVVKEWLASAAPEVPVPFKKELEPVVAEPVPAKEEPELVEAGEPVLVETNSVSVEVESVSPEVELVPSEVDETEPAKKEPRPVEEQPASVPAEVDEPVPVG